MEIRWLLLAACILSCMSGLICESSEDNEVEVDDTGVGESTAQLLAEMFGIKDFDPKTTSGQVSPESSYEPQETVKDNPTVHCIILRPSAVKAFGVIESRHPGIADIKYKVLEDIVTYASSLSSFRSENCSSGVKLLDLIIASATELREEYTKITHDNCVYSSVDENSFQKRTTPAPVTKPPTESSKAPCEEVTKPPCVTTPKSQTEKPCPDVTTPKSQTEKPCPKELEVTTQESRSTEKSTKRPCPEDTSTTGVTEKPCPDGSYVTDEQPEEVIAEEDYDERPPLVGSLRGIPGVHYPNYTDVPITSFSCADKKYIPGFYADLETGCQVFHVCYEHRRESFLCPLGTVFNQPILACDYWYSSNCSLAPVYYEVNAKADATKEDVDLAVDELVSVLVEQSTPESTEAKPQEQVLEDIAKFLPVKAKVVEFPKTPEVKVVEKKPEIVEAEDIASDIFDKIISTATDVVSKTKDVIEKLPEPKYKPVILKPKVLPVFKVKPFAAKAPLAKAAVTKAKLAAAIPAVKIAAAIPVAAAKAAAAAVPIATKVKIAAVAPKVAVPVATKVKLAAVAPKVAVPVAKKVKLAAVAPKVVAKASLPALKAKMIASAIPFAKAKLSTPVFKGKALKAAAIPLVKGKMLAVPLAQSKLMAAAPVMKAKMIKAAAISPLTKKALALGYMKLLKAKKLALMG